MTDPRRYLAGLFLVLFATVLQAGIAGAQALTIQNQWTGAFISDAGGASLTGDANDPAAQWQFEPVDGSGPERIRNAATGNYLHVEGGALQAGPIDPGAPTAHWAREQADGDAFRIQSLGQPGTYLNVETGPLQAGPVEPGWLSARWVIRDAAPAADAPVVAEAPAAEKPPTVEEPPLVEEQPMAEEQPQPMESMSEATPSPDEEQLVQSPIDEPTTLQTEPDQAVAVDAEPLPDPAIADAAGADASVLPDAGGALPDAGPAALPSEATVDAPASEDQALAPQDDELLPSPSGESLPDPAIADAAGADASVLPDAGGALPDAGPAALPSETTMDAPASEDQALAPQDDELLPSPSGESLPDASPATAYEALPDPGQDQASVAPQDGLLPPPPGGRAASGVDAPTAGGGLPPAGEPQMSAAASETLPEAPTVAGEVAADMPTLSEATGQAPIQLVVQNRSGAPLDVFIGVPGQDPAYVQTVGPGQQLLQQSPAGAMWSIAQEDDWVGDYQLSDAPVQLIQFP